MTAVRSGTMVTQHAITNTPAREVTQNSAEASTTAGAVPVGAMIFSDARETRI